MQIDNEKVIKEGQIDNPKVIEEWEAWLGPTLPPPPYQEDDYYP